ncbi:MAG TPA: hypothetical protein VFW73_04810, partial [Lacipirellulaceae bacterium]|nr:hypothetical protein [Lacipirellulaceae bacterium]
QLYKFVLDKDFNDRVRHSFPLDWSNLNALAHRHDAVGGRSFVPDWEDLNAEWQAYIATLDYGYDFDRMAIEFQTGKPLAGQSASATIAADRGWQTSGVWLDAGKSYHITAAGRYQIAAEQLAGKSTPWLCEPGGITIEYHAGRPLGMLLGAIDRRGNRTAASGGSFAEPLAIGTQATIKTSVSGTLYFRVNDSAAKLDDNRGTLSIKVASRP